MLRAISLNGLVCSLILCLTTLGTAQESNSGSAADETTADRRTGDSAPSADPPASAATAEPAAVESPPSKESAASTESAPSTSDEPGQAAEADNQVRIKDLLSLVSDNTLFNHARENRAYFALVKEVMRQTPEQLRSQARENPRFNDFFKKPAEHRGELVHLALNLRRILPIDIKNENEAGVTKLYELWGWTDEAKAFMYCCITPELPPGFPTEGDVAERIEMTGYFFKMQAYQPGDAPPNARNLVAPVIIGRVVNSPKVVSAEGQGLGNWPLVLIVGFGIIIAFRLVMQARSSRLGPTHRNYRRRSLESHEPLDTESMRDALGTRDKGLQIRNADE